MNTKVENVSAVIRAYTVKGAVPNVLIEGYIVP